MRSHFVTTLLVTLSLAPWVIFGREVIFINKCNRDIWISPLTNAQGPLLQPGIVKMEHDGRFSYNIPDGGWEGRFWPKMGCDGSGQNCEIGQSDPPCPSTGCDPPGDTKVEFNFPPKGGPPVYYDVSLVDGYTVPATIVPNRDGEVCKPVNCRVSMDSCPRNEKHDLNDLRAYKNNQAVQCLSPCKKWNSPSPYGLGRPENEQPGYHLCCPDPVTVEECRGSIVVQTEFVKLVHRECPTAYAYSYDDENGNYNCPNDVSFDVTFCQ